MHRIPPLFLSPGAHVLPQIRTGRTSQGDGSSDLRVRGRVTLGMGGNCVFKSWPALCAISHVRLFSLPSLRVCGSVFEGMTRRNESDEDGPRVFGLPLPRVDFVIRDKRKTSGRTTKVDVDWIKILQIYVRKISVSGGN